jgi:hypothetical protein
MVILIRWPRHWTLDRRIRFPGFGLAMDKLGCYDRLRRIMVHGLHGQGNVCASYPSRKSCKETQRNIRSSIPLSLRRQESLLAAVEREPLSPLQHGLQRTDLHFLGRLHCPRLWGLVSLFCIVSNRFWRAPRLVARASWAGLHGYWHRRHNSNSLRATPSPHDQQSQEGS